MQPDKILVTGADGFIGSHLCEALVKAGHRVRAMVMYNAFDHFGNLDSLPRETLAQLEIFPADIRDAGRVDQAVDSISRIFHLASLIGIPYSYVAPESYLDTNVRGSLNLLQSARRAGVAHFVHTSTSEVYGTAQSKPMNENHPLEAQSPYAASKIAADQMVNAFGRSYNLPITIIRPFNTYGPRQSARAIIPTIIGQLAQDQKGLKLGATETGRDLTFVSDIVSGFLATIDCQASLGKTINLGSGVEISIGALAKRIGHLMKRDFELQVDQQRLRPQESEVSSLLCDNSLAQEILNWSPEVPLDDGLTLTIEQLLNQPQVAKNRPERYQI